jgi:hypothetical protein
MARVPLKRSGFFFIVRVAFPCISRVLHFWGEGVLFNVVAAYFIPFLGCCNLGIIMFLKDFLFFVVSETTY